MYLKRLTPAESQANTTTTTTTTTSNTNKDIMIWKRTGKSME